MTLVFVEVVSKRACGKLGPCLQPTQPHGAYTVTGLKCMHACHVLPARKRRVCVCLFFCKGDWVPKGVALSRLDGIARQAF